jgi:hypothetical protein
MIATASTVVTGSTISCVVGFSFRFSFFAISTSPLWNPSTLTLLESLLAMPVGLLCWPCLLLLFAANVLRLHLDLTWSNQLDPASLTSRRCHVGRIEPVII